MSLFEEASLVITPNGFKAGKLYAVKGADLDVVRATSATRVNANGVIETVASNVPRIDYSGGGCPSILVEPQRTNSILNSATVATQTIVTGAVAYTLSFYGTGTITLSGTHTATVVGLGTARKTYTFTPSAGILILTVSGTCTNGQLEAGSYATSYIPTTSASVTRNADVISKTGISSLIGQTEGVVFADFVYNGKYGSAPNGAMPISLDDGSGSQEAYFYLEPSNNRALAQFVVGGALTCNIQGLVMSVGTRYKMALAYKQNDFAFYINGVLQGTDTSGNIAPLSNVRLCNYSGLNYMHDNLNLSALWKTRLTNAELAELTTL
jgi:hypothetical protein